MIVIFLGDVSKVTYLKVFTLFISSIDGYTNRSRTWYCDGAYDGMHVGRFTAYLSVQTAMNLCRLYD